MLVLADADLPQAAELIISGGTSFGGQKCSATSRVIVDAAVADDLCEHILSRFEQLRIGNPLEAETQIGPLIDDAARIRALGAIRDAQTAGARLLGGGEPLDRPGWFFKPALLDVPNPAADLVQREIFAPVIAVQRAAGIEQAIELANDSLIRLFCRHLHPAARCSGKARTEAAVRDGETQPRDRRRRSPRPIRRLG